MLKKVGLMILGLNLILACEQITSPLIEIKTSHVEPILATSTAEKFTPSLNLKSMVSHDCAEEVIVGIDNSGHTYYTVTPNLPCEESPLVDPQIDLTGDFRFQDTIISMPNIPHWRDNPPDPGFVRGERLAYVSMVNGQEDIFISHTDGSHFIRVTNSPQHERNPVFSPEGHFISYTTNQFQRGWELFETFAQGKLITRLTFDMLNAQPVEWSSQNELLFLENGFLHIYNPILKQIRSLIPTQQIQSPVWSSDGNTIAYVYQGDIYAIDRLGQQNQIFVKGPQVTGKIDWSSDDKEIVFESKGRILKHAVGSDFALLQQQPELLGAYIVLSNQGDMEPIFSPDNKKVAFTSTRTGQKEIFVMDSYAGLNPYQVTHHPYESYQPAW